MLKLKVMPDLGVVGRGEAQQQASQAETILKAVRLDERLVHRRGHSQSTDVVALELAVQGRAADAQHLARKLFVALHLREDAFDRHALQMLQMSYVRQRRPCCRKCPYAAH